MKRAILAATALLATAHARPSLSYQSTPAKHYQCEDFIVPITLENITTVDIGFDEVKDQIHAVAILNSLTARSDSPPPAPKLTTLSGTYDIATRYCSPTDKSNASTALQILVHGIGYNASYWDFSLPTDLSSSSNYSYISAATAAGYSTLSYNRLGTSNSTLANPLSEVQLPVHIAIATQLTALARSGSLPNHAPPAPQIIHIGHSYGSLIIGALAATSPTLSDAIIETGWAYSSTAGPLFLAATNHVLANLHDPARFPARAYPNAYFTWPTAAANQYAFFAAPAFDPAALAHAEATKHPFALGEFLSQGAGPSGAPDFAGPVLYVNGEKDMIACGGNCTGLVEQGTAAYGFFNGTQDVESVLIKGAGHGLTAHYSAPESAATILEWVKRKGF